MMLTQSNSMRTRHSGKEIDEKDSSSISTMSSIDIGSEGDDDYESDCHPKIESKMVTETRTESTGSKTGQSTSPILVTEHIKEEAASDNLSEGDEDEVIEDVEENWSLFDGSEEFPMLEDEEDSEAPKNIPELNIKESHDSSRFVGSMKEEIHNQEESFVIPRPDSLGNFLHTSISKDSEPSKSLDENKSTVTILSSHAEDSGKEKEDELFSLGADILMEKSLMTGKLTLEDPSQATESSLRKSTHVTTYRSTLNPKFGILSAMIVLLSVRLCSMYYIKKERSYWLQEMDLLRKDFEKREYMLRKDMEERERIHVEALANATSCEENDIPMLPWEERDSNTLFSIENCWLSAQASFEWGLCPKKLKQDIMNRLRIDNRVFDVFPRTNGNVFDDGADNNSDLNDPSGDIPTTTGKVESHTKEFVVASMEKATVALTSWKHNFEGMAKDFLNTVVLPDDPRSLLDGSVWTDIVYEGHSEKK